MSIDWITFAAQIINLAILVVLLYKFLFKPLLGAIDKREATIAAEVKCAKDAVAEADRRLAELNKKHEQIEEQRKAVLQQAHTDAEALRLRLEAEVRQSAAQTRDRWEQDLAQERIALETEMRDLVITNFKTFAQKALSELADSGFEKRMIDVFKQRFETLDESEKKRLTLADAETAEAFVTTMFELSPESQNELKRLTGIETLVFKTEPRVMCGIELSVNGQLLSWNFESYLREFTQSLKDALDNISARLTSAE